MQQQERVLIVGAGLAGSVLARCLADAGVPSLVIDRREHVAGMCYSSVDAETGVEVHRFGPHTFHTGNERVWEFVQRFDTWYPWVARAMCTHARGVFSLPINLHTINQLFGKQMTPAEARAFVERLQDKSIHTPANAEEQLLRFVGRDIYETFFRDYTIKQWGVSPRELAPDIVKRIPVRFNYDNNYYFDRYQGYPVHGYTAWVENMLRHPLIELRLATDYEKSMNAEFAHVFYSGPLDEYFMYCAGELSYRTVDFRYERGEADLLGCSWMNFTDMRVPYTRAHEHKYFSPWTRPKRSVVLYEYSREASRADDRFYPKRMPEDMQKLAQYVAMAEAERGVTFVGRLGCYRYLDMHLVVEASMALAERWLAGERQGLSFSTSPL